MLSALLAVRLDGYHNIFLTLFVLTVFLLIASAIVPQMRALQSYFGGALLLILVLWGLATIL